MTEVATTEAEMADLDLDLLDLSPRVGRGRQAVDLHAEFTRELTTADLAMPPAASSQPAKIKALRDSHHGLARVLATGISESEASAITGYSPSRISILKADPTFKELLEFYRMRGEAVVTDFRERMAITGMTALQVLQERLEDDPEEITAGTLREIVKDMADRTGHAPPKGPTNVTNVNVELGDRMAKARERVAQARAPKIIEHE